MKTFKALVQEVAEPRSPDERRFKAKHVIKKYDHPVKDDAEENQFKGGTTKDRSKKASYKDGEDEAVYEAYSTWHAQHPSKPTKSYKVKAQNVGQAMDKAHKAAIKAGDLASNVSKYIWKTKHMKKLDEEAGFESGENTETDPTVSNFSQFRKRDAKAKKDNNTGDAKGGFVSDGPRTKEDFVKKNKHAIRTKGDVEINTDIADNVTNEEVDYIDEAVSAGTMKLNDGSKVKLTNEDANAMNELFSELNSSNKKKMEEEMMASKSGFDKILKFAKEAQ